ncbi:hypothetical protein [Lysinibacillus sp. RC79]|uniref:hypothetical protein n=1 Tax=Lysinibacillus sp. RC79 TaxID=3156296 RepID=UPI003512DCC0
MNKEQIKKSLDHFFEKNNLPSEKSIERMLNYKNQKPKKNLVLYPKYLFGFITTIVTVSCIIFILGVIKPTESTVDVTSNKNSKLLEELNLEKVQMEPLNNTFFNVLVYEMQYFQSAFWTKEEAKLHSFDSLIERTAMMTFAQSKGIEVNDKEIEELAKQKNTKYLHEISQEKAVSEYGDLFKALGISENEYYKDVVYFNAKYELLESRLLKELSIRNKNSEEYNQLYRNAIHFYMEVAADDITRFKEGFQIVEQLSVKKLNSLKEPVEVSFDYKNISALALGQNSNGELEFINPRETWNYILEVYAEILYKADEGNEKYIPFAPKTYNKYKASLKKFAENSSNEYQTEAIQLLEILNIFEHSYNEEYQFE